MLTVTEFQKMEIFLDCAESLTFLGETKLHRNKRFIYKLFSFPQAFRILANFLTSTIVLNIKHQILSVTEFRVLLMF